ncbi:Regulator of G protein signaling superfamily [Penicillium vulpinum]|uniref:RGS domain-containing protein n=1 Tax=Penicillium vulpinum TaxID=29845 RepID=A0A1V6S8R4_9EURO|nr:Regulator of G protein signaling superfamily [Penicillium vulpinum]KAJ5951898.1 Regulator of G protein signaling superfamily [Penicillium vulpinum]OQE10421.1 hypothetical protein PENVUL_c004G05479 [Penicillium vulpinum]
MGSEYGVTAASKPQVDLRPVAIWWAVWAFVWTSTLLAGMIYLIVNRDMPALRIRGLALSLTSIVILHLYWLPTQLAVMLGPVMPGDAAYWLMGTLLPCGIALFHGSNTRFQHVAKLQRKYALDGYRFTEPPTLEHKAGLINRFRALRYTTKILIYVAIAMFAQVFLTILMWLISRKYHSSWGIPGTEVTGTPAEVLEAQGTGWEWWPGVVSQFFWSWIVAPIVLWKSRNIHDSHGWRVQTIGCAVSSLHATPMWLIALYVPAMAPVNAVFVPPQWIGLSILVIEILTVFLPCWEVMRHQSLRQETLESIARWELKVKSTGSEEKSLNSDMTVVASMMSGWKSNSSASTFSSRDSILTMGALEHVLERNPAPLQEFSALREFSGENIIFLTSVAEWRSRLPSCIKDGSAKQERSKRSLVREHFNRALHIYAEFISVRHAEFPVNISHQELRKLEDVFEQPTRLVYGEKRDCDIINPFDKFTFDLPQPSSVSTDSGKTMQAGTARSIKENVQYWGDIPVDFEASIFDDAEASIKYLVLTNTWPKFIRDRRTLPSIDSIENLKGIEV